VLILAGIAFVRSDSSDASTTVPALADPDKPEFAQLPN
jgi:hypothetical protein